MADQQLTVAIRITDPTTPSQQASVDGLGRLTTVSVQGTGNGGTSPWSVSGSVTVINAIAVTQSTTPWIVSGGVDIGAPLPPGANTIGNVNLNAGSNTIGKVDQGIGNAGTSPWAVSGTVAVSNFTSSSPTSPVTILSSVTSLAPLASGTVQTTALATGSTFYLWGMDFTSSVPVKAVLRQTVNSVTTDLTTLIAEAGEPVQFRPPSSLFFPIAAVGAANRWSVVLENLDASLSADAYATFYYSN